MATIREAFSRGHCCSAELWTTVVKRRGGTAISADGAALQFDLDPIDERVGVIVGSLASPTPLRQIFHEPSSCRNAHWYPP